MTQCRKTTFDELYSTLVTLIYAVTGRPTWRKMGLQVSPKGGYATVYLKQGPSPTQDVVEIDTELTNGVGEYPVGLTRLECKAEFFRGIATQSALDAAVRFRQSLQLQSRFFDLWQIAGLVGEISLIDVSEMFRSDIEGRAEIHFNLYADIGAPIINTDYLAGEIDSVELGVYRDTATPPPVADITITREV